MSPIFDLALLLALCCIVRPAVQPPLDTRDYSEAIRHIKSAAAEHGTLPLHILLHRGRVGLMYRRRVTHLPLLLIRPMTGDAVFL